MVDENTLRQIFSKNLNYYLSCREMSQNELSRRLDVSSAAVNKWVKGESMPRMGKIDAICSVLKIERSDLLEERNPFGRLTQCYKLPVIGAIAGGTPIEAYQDIDPDDWVEVPANLFSNGQKYIALRVEGDSMEPTICDGDIAVIKISYEWQNGAVMAVYVNGYNATLKRVRIAQNGLLTLQPFNPAHEPQIFTPEEQEEKPVRPLGVLVELRKRYDYTE